MLVWCRSEGREVGVGDGPTRGARIQKENKEGRGEARKGRKGMQTSNLLPGESFPRAPVAPAVSPPPSTHAQSLRSSRKLRHVPFSPSAEVVTSFAFPVPRTSGSSAQHGDPCCSGRSKCGVAGRGKRPVE